VASHFIGVVRVLERVCARAGLQDVTPHTLRHTFASVAGDLNFSELTIRGLLGHAGQGVTQRYVHIDQALVLAADKTANKENSGLKYTSTAALPKFMIRTTSVEHSSILNFGCARFGDR